MSRPGSPPLLAPARAARLLDDVIFTRVVELIDLPQLYDLEALLALQLESMGASSDEARATAKAMVDRALLRFARTSRKWTRLEPPCAHCAHDAHDTTCEICGSPGDPPD